MNGESLIEKWKIDLEQLKVISVVGAGGKTSVIFQLAEELMKIGKRVAITTTTHMQHPDVLKAEGVRVPGVFASEIPENGDISCLITGIRQDKEKHAFKISAPDDTVMNLLKKKYDIILIEADGSRKKPVKAYKEWEPVVPEDTDLVIAVLGLSGLEQRICDTAYAVPELCRLLKKTEQEILTPEDYAVLLSESGGLLDRFPGKKVVLLNQADTKERVEAGEVIKRYMKPYSIPVCVENIHIYPEEYDEYAVILLAAGNSVRYGKNKLLECYQGRPMYCLAVDKMRSLKADKIVVTQYQEVRKYAENAGFQVVMNPHPEYGISRSMKLGIEAAGKKTGYLFTVCDQPKMPEEVFHDMLRIAKSQPDHIIAARTPDGGYANPNLFPHCFVHELEQITGDKGGKKVILEHPEAVTGYSISMEAAHDIDVPEEWNR